MMWFGISPASTAPGDASVVLLIGFLVGLGLLLAAVQVRFRDVGLAMPLLVQVWLFATSGALPPRRGPDRFRSRSIGSIG